MVPIDECESNIPYIRWRVTTKNDDSPCRALTKVSVPQLGNKNKRKGNGAGLAWESQCFADEFVITHEHSFGTDTQHDYSQGNFRTMSLIIIKL